jgi:hypothetical protein
MISQVAIVTAFIALTTPLRGVAQSAAPAPQTQSKAKKPGSGGIGGTAGKTAEKKSTQATVLTVGTVSSVGPNSLTIRSTSGDDVTFSVDADTRLLTPGISAKAKTGSTKASKKTPSITEMIKAGDTVSVRSKDAEGTKHATAVTIRRGSAEK